MGKFDIQFHEVPHNRPVRTFVRERLQNWLKEQLGQLKRPEVKIEFSRAPFGKEIGCYIEIRKGDLIWRGFEYGKGIQHTLHSCLGRLSETSLLERSVTAS